MTNKTTEGVLHHEEIIRILKKEIASRAGKFLGLTTKQEHEDNIICLDEHQIIIPTKGIRFSAVEFPSDLI